MSSIFPCHPLFTLGTVPLEYSTLHLHAVVYFDRKALARSDRDLAEFRYIFGAMVICSQLATHFAPCALFFPHVFSAEIDVCTVGEAARLLGQRVAFASVCWRVFTCWAVEAIRASSVAYSVVSLGTRHRRGRWSGRWCWRRCWRRCWR